MLPGNLYSDPVRITFDPKSPRTIRLTADNPVVYSEGHFNLRTPAVGSTPY